MDGSSGAGSRLGSGVGKVLPPTRRPDGTMRKEIRIRTGYVPQEEVPKYEARGSKPKNSGPVVPAGVDPQYWAEQQAKISEKKNTKKKKKEKSQQSSVQASTTDSLQSVQSSLTDLKISDTAPKAQTPASISISKSTNDVSKPNAAEASSETHSEKEVPEKKIRALKKKIRQAEALLDKIQNGEATAEQKDKFSKIESWNSEIAELEKELQGK